MKLRNKKTGEIRDGRVEVVFQNNDKFPNPLERHTVESIDELNEEWEDYKPEEPLIKDEKIRKAVRAWAEANGIGVIKIMSEFKVRDVETPCEISFWHNTFVCELVGNSYTIEELCEEEK